MNNSNIVKERIMKVRQENDEVINNAKKFSRNWFAGKTMNE